VALGFQVPGECQGQIVEYAYACAGHRILRRIHDRSDGETTYHVADIKDDDWGWYEDWQHDDGAPPISDDRWRPISECEVDTIMEDWQ
jgi:hypothetical protein